MVERNESTKAIILSAGHGTRLLPITREIPKVMIPIGDKPVLEHLIRLCASHNIQDVIINLHYLPDVITNHFADGSKFGVHITYLYEEEKILGGAGAIKNAESLVNGDFLVMDGDVMTNLNLKKILNFHREKKGIATFLVHKTNHPYDSDCVQFDENSRITKFFRPKEGDIFDPMSKSGTHIFTPEVFQFIPKDIEFSLEHQLIPLLLSQGKSCYAYYSTEYSRDMGTPKRLEEVREDYQLGKISY
ncbi:MAG TPA: NDP-sugar synthase [Candidatus Saccharimonadales bacterium]|nr:NDP-sugar synthase [Candidatus Saccharimonadales bacterium]